MRNLVSVACVALAVVAFAERQPYERYETIVKRQMFGPLPPGFDPTKSPSEVVKTTAKTEKELTKEQEQIKKAIRFSVMNVNAAGEACVGFTDSADPKKPVHYYLKVGETQNGWTVKEADSATSTMTIANAEGIEVTLQLGGDSATNASAVSRPGASAPQESAANARLQRDRGLGTLFGGGLRNRREQRRQLEAQLQADVAKRAEEASQRAEAEKQRAAREAEEKQQREAEREEHRKQLVQIQEELRKAREERESAEKKGRDEGAGNGVSEE